MSVPIPVIHETMLPAQKAAINSNVSDILSMLGFARTLTEEQRRGGFKWGPKSEGFVDYAFEAAGTRPDILPASFMMGDFTLDMNLIRDIRSFSPSIVALGELVSDTLMILQMQAMEKARRFYQIVKQEYESGTPGLEAIYHQLSERFAHTSSEEEEGEEQKEATQEK